MNFAIKIIQPSDFSSIDAVVQFHSEIATVLISEADIVLVDLSKITSVASANFIGLVKGLKLILASDRQLFICSMNEQVRILFELTGLDQVFKSFYDRAEFYQYVQPATKVEAFKPKTSVSTLKLVG